jgi:hypothetical protein
MQIQVDIEFDQLLKVVKALTPGQLKLLNTEIKRTTKTKKDNSDVELEKLLMNGPVATQKQLDIINSNRKVINQWRKK